MSSGDVADLPADSGITAAAVKPSRLLAWLRLLRLPTVFTALSNILCGYLITQDGKMSELLQQPDLYLLLLASSGLYLGGMVLNDVYDAALDAVERPDRPIPSGLVARRSALILGNLLLLLGVVSAGLAGSSSLRVALLLALAVVAYDTWLKNSAAGCAGMAVCRFLNLMLGASAAGHDGTGIWQLPQLGIAGGLGLYILGVTWFARNEAGQSSVRSLWTGLLVALGGIAVQAVVIATADFQPRSTTGALLVLGLTAANIFVRSAQAIELRQPIRIQQTVGLMLLSIIFLDAAAVFAATGSAGPAALIVALVIPAVLMKRVIPLS